MVFLTHHLTEHFSEAWRHEVIQDGIDHWAQVEEDTRKKMHVLKDMVVLCSPVIDVAPHDTIDVKRAQQIPNTITNAPVKYTASVLEMTYYSKCV